MKSGDSYRENQILLKILRGENPDFKGISETTFFSLIKVHRLVSYFHNRIINGELTGQSEELEERISEYCRKAAAHSAALKADLKRLSNLFESEKIPFLLLKGFSLSHLLYPEDELRFFADNDILVKPDNLFRAEKILKELGSEPIEGWHFKFSVDDSARFGISRPYINAKARYLQTDLHPGIGVAPGLKLATTEDIWSEVHSFEWEGRQYRTLPLDLYFIYLCWHALKHSLCRLIWFRDIKLFLDKFGDILDDERFYSKIEKYQVSRIVGIVLLLIKEVFADDSYLNKYRKRRIDCKMRLNGFFRSNSLFTLRDELPPYKRLIRDTLLLERWNDRIRYSFNFIFPTPALLPELEGKASSRLSPIYLKSRVQTLLKSIKRNRILPKSGKNIA